MMSRKFSGSSVTCILGLTFRKNLAFAIIAAVFSLLLGPARLYKMIIDRAGPSYPLSQVIKEFRFSRDFENMAFIFAALSGVFLLFLIIHNFSYLFKKSASDAFHSYPLTRTTLLICRLIPALVFSLVPLAVGYVGEVAVALGFGIEIDLLYVAKTFLFSASMLLLCGATTVLFALCSGTVFDMLVSMCALVGGLPLAIVIIHALSLDHLNGYTSDSIYPLLSYTSPYAYAIYSLSTIGRWDYTDPLALRWYSFALSLAATAVILFLCTYLYNRRKSEKAGEPFAFKFIPIIIAFVFAFLCGTLLGIAFSDLEILSVTFWVFAIIGAVLGAIIYGAVAKRGFKGVLNSVKIGGVSFVAIILVVAIILSGGLGFETRIPKDKNIITANVHFGSYDLDFKGEEVSFITDLHKAMISGDTTNEYGMQYITLSYTLKNGSEIKRAYLVTTKTGADELVAIYKSDVFKKSIMAFYEESDKFYDFSYGTFDKGHKEMVADKGNIKTFMELYIKELDTLTVKDLASYDRNQSFREVNLNYLTSENTSLYRYFYIYPNMKETIKYLEQLEKKPEVSEDEKYLEEKFN